MKKKNYIIDCVNCDGGQMSTTYYGTLLGAKRAASDFASGSTTAILITDKDGNEIARRIARDSYWGCCKGWQKWHLA